VVRSALSSLRSARSHDFALLASRTRAPLMGGQHHPKRGPAQPQLSGLAARRPQSPSERRRAAASRRGECAATKDTKNTKRQGPLPPPPPSRPMPKISTVTVGSYRTHLRVWPLAWRRSRGRSTQLLTNLKKQSRTRTKDPKPTQVSGITAGVHECTRTHKGPQVEPDRPTKGIVQLPTTLPPRS
jgi:hypothetical protein